MKEQVVDMFLYWLDKLEPSLVPSSEQASLVEAVQSKAFDECFPFKQKALQGLGFVCSRFGEFLLPSSSAITDLPPKAPPYSSGTVARSFVQLLRTNKLSSNAKLVDLRSQVPTSFRLLVPQGIMIVDFRLSRIQTSFPGFAILEFHHY